VIVHCSLHFWMSGSDPHYTFLPLALVGMTTAVIFGVHLVAEPFSGHDRSFKQHQSILKGINQ
jgi:hypothetical protein